MNLSDEERESIIDTFAAMMRGAQSPALRRYWWSMLREMVLSRTPEQVRKMEKEKGIAA